MRWIYMVVAATLALAGTGAPAPVNREHLARGAPLAQVSAGLVRVQTVAPTLVAGCGLQLAAVAYVDPGSPRLWVYSRVVELYLTGRPDAAWVYGAHDLGRAVAFYVAGPTGRIAYAWYAGGPPFDATAVCALLTLPMIPGKTIP